MKTDLEVEVQVDLRQLGKVLIFRDKQTNRTFLLYIDEHKCDRAGLETIEPKSIKRIANKILKKKLSAYGEYEHKCDPTQIETIDPNCRFRSQSAHRPRLVLIGDFPVTHSFLQSSHLVVQAFCIFWSCIVYC